MKRFFLTFFSVFLFLITFSPVLAVTVNVSGCPASITDQPFDCSFSIEGSTSEINYLRIDLYKDGTSNYFGETFSNEGWYGGSDGKQYLSTSTSSGSIKGKIGNPSSTEYPGSGSYKIRLRRYTASGNPASGDTQTPKDISINFQAPTPSPTDTPSPTSTPTNTPTPTATPTKTVIPTKKPTATPTKSKSTPTPTESSVNLPQSILGASASATETPTPTKAQENSFNFMNLVFIAGGIILILLGIFAFTFVAKGKFKGI